MARRMRDATFREEQIRGLRAAHIAPINALVDRLCDPSGEIWAPYVAPMYGGVNACLLSVLRDPGPKTNVDHGGSGFLCMENDDATAERISTLFADVGIGAADVVPWNAYPWYINKAPTAAQLDSGVGPLLELIELMPRLRVVMLHGGSAHSGWRRLARRSPSTIADLTVIETYHTSRQAFWHPDPAIREQRAVHLAKAFIDAADALARQQPTQ
ncbi:uracil-DNA glycosylase [Jatrophihabitans cynanchi]|uniref:Uracil-DNA glycosylase n=1 Tax=Jatrophihabitans cynanchi TaxID=2944128 RepID=A0ABY7JVU9_9ACTN|nr:uracil-DNA glycosylase [Jatrophihabitans sp. SB3-54]WAX55815.1 uracil-DNA glycosylase [Jatrophihabitans sp. SB3-54]